MNDVRDSKMHRSIPKIRHTVSMKNREKENGHRNRNIDFVSFQKSLKTSLLIFNILDTKSVTDF